MQKKLIALAVAGLVSAPAFAADNVTIYGVMGAYYQNQHTSTAGVGATINSLNTDGQSGSRLGFKGTEDLGNGLKAVFTVETGILTDTAKERSPQGLGDRQVFVGLQGGFGGLTAGRQYSPMFGLAAGTVDTWGYADWSSFLMAGLANNTRVNNSVLYVTPSMSGFTGKLMYAFGEQASNNVAHGAGNQWGFSAEYANGPLKAGLAHHKVKSGTPDLTVGDILGSDCSTLAAVYLNGAGTCSTVVTAGTASAGSNKWTLLGGSYNFGVVAAQAGYQWEKTAAGVKAKAWTLGLTAPVGPAGTVLAQYSRRNPDGANNTKNAYSLGYSHALSKRTNLVAAYARSAQEVAGASDTTDRRVVAGIRHTF